MTDYPKPLPRKPLTRVQFATLIIRQDCLCGCGCGARLVADAIEDEHINPLDNLGSNDLSNRALYTKECAKKKTGKLDKPRAAKSARLRGETGQRARREARGGSMIKGRGFSTTHTRGFDGKVKVRE